MQKQLEELQKQMAQAEKKEVETGSATSSMAIPKKIVTKVTGHRTGVHAVVGESFLVAR